MTPWTRDDTKSWIDNLEDRIDDIAYYIDQTIHWCDENGVDDDHVVFICSFLTCIWVSQLRGEDITLVELMEMLGIDEVQDFEEKIYELDASYLNMAHVELLEQAVRKLSSDGDY